MTPIVKCNSSAFCGSLSAIETRTKLFDSQITSIVCDTLQNCDGISPSKARMLGLKTIIECNTNGKCGNRNHSYTDANMSGIQPVVPCSSVGNCSGVSPASIRMKGMKPIVYCSSNGQCP